MSDTIEKIADAVKGFGLDVIDSGKWAADKVRSGTAPLVGKETADDVYWSLSLSAEALGQTIHGWGYKLNTARHWEGVP